jgi:hypothetical protein
MSQFPEAAFSPTMVSGYRAVDDIISTRIKPDVWDEIFTYQPNANAVTLLLKKGKPARTVSQYTYFILQKDRYPVRDRVNLAAGYDADDTDIVVDNGGRFFAGAVVRNTKSNERFRVTSISDNTLTVVRNLGSTAAPMANNDELEIIGSAYSETDDVRTAVSIQEEAVFNYTQTFRTPFSFGGRELNTDMFGAKDLNAEQKWQASEHAQFIERALWWGVRDTVTDATTSKTNSFTGGVHYWIQNRNEWDLNGIDFNERNLTEYLEEAMRYGRGGRGGKKTKYLFCGSRYVTEVESWAKDRLRYVPSSKIYGLNASVYQSFHGRIILIDHPLFEGENADKAFLLDLNHLRLVQHQGRSTRLLRNRQGNGIDGVTHEFMSDLGLEVQLPFAHGFIHGLTV